MGRTLWSDPESLDKNMRCSCIDTSVTFMYPEGPKTQYLRFLVPKESYSEWSSAAES